MFLLHVLISITLNKRDRFELLSLSIKLFYFYLSQIEECNEDDLFTPSFHNKTSIGTLFGTYDYIIRCINTCVAVAISIEISDNFSFPLAVSRVSSIVVECYYGKVRMLSNYNHTLDNSLSATVNAKILHRICEELGYKVSIRTRANNVDVVLTNEILHGHCAPVDFSFLFDTLFFLFESVKMNRFQIKAFEYLINNYSNYLQSSDYPQVKVASVYCGTMPHYRYVTNKYVQSLLPVPSLLNTRSAFDFFVTNKKLTNV